MILLLATLLLQDDWPQWRGPRMNGSVEGGTRPVKWDAPAWSVKLPGKGGSTPIVVKDRIYVTCPSEGQDAVLAFELGGKPAWETKLGPKSEAKHKTLGSSSNASPVSDGSGLYVYFRSGRLAALELDGKPRWQIDILEKYGPEKLFWDQGSSPVVVGELLVLSRLHGGESWVAAFDKKSGELRWKKDRTIKVPVENDNGYATPLVVRHEDKTALIVWGSDLLTAYDAANGDVLWSCGGFNPEGTGYWPAISTPVIAGDLVVVPVGRDDRAGQARVHGIRLGGKGDVTSTHRVWSRQDLGVFVPTPAEYQGRVYLLRHRGEVVCLDPASGKTLWAEALPRGAASYYASPLVAGGVLYAAREDGAVFAARVGDKFELLGENRMGERVVASPAPARNLLLIRGDSQLFGLQ